MSLSKEQEQRLEEIRQLTQDEFPWDGLEREGGPVGMVFQCQACNQFSESAYRLAGGMQVCLECYESLSETKEASEANG